MKYCISGTNRDIDVKQNAFLLRNFPLSFETIPRKNSGTLLHVFLLESLRSFIHVSKIRSVSLQYLIAVIQRYSTNKMVWTVCYENINRLFGMHSETCSIIIAVMRFSTLSSTSSTF